MILASSTTRSLMAVVNYCATCGARIAPEDLARGAREVDGAVYCREHVPTEQRVVPLTAAAPIAPVTARPPTARRLADTPGTIRPARPTTAKRRATDRALRETRRTGPRTPLVIIIVGLVIALGGALAVLLSSGPATDGDGGDPVANLAGTGTDDPPTPLADRSDTAGNGGEENEFPAGPGRRWLARLKSVRNALAELRRRGTGDREFAFETAKRWWPEANSLRASADDAPVTDQHREEARELASAWRDVAADAWSTHLETAVRAEYARDVGALSRARTILGRALAGDEPSLYPPDLLDAEAVIPLRSLLEQWAQEHATQLRALLAEARPEHRELMQQLCELCDRSQAFRMQPYPQPGDPADAWWDESRGMVEELIAILNTMPPEGRQPGSSLWDVWYWSTDPLYTVMIHWLERATADLVDGRYELRERLALRYEWLVQNMNFRRSHRYHIALQNCVRLGNVPAGPGDSTEFAHLVRESMQAVTRRSQASPIDLVRLLEEVIRLDHLSRTYRVPPVFDREVQQTRFAGVTAVVTEWVRRAEADDHVAELARTSWTVSHLVAHAGRAVSGGSTQRLGILMNQLERTDSDLQAAADMLTAFCGESDSPDDDRVAMTMPYRIRLLDDLLKRHEAAKEEGHEQLSDPLQAALQSLVSRLLPQMAAVVNSRAETRQVSLARAWWCLSLRSYTLRFRFTDQWPQLLEACRQTADAEIARYRELPAR